MVLGTNMHRFRCSKSSNSNSSSSPRSSSSTAPKPIITEPTPNHMVAACQPSTTTSGGVPSPVSSTVLVPSTSNGSFVNQPQTIISSSRKRPTAPPTQHTEPYVCYTKPNSDMFMVLVPTPQGGASEPASSSSSSLLNQSYHYQPTSTQLTSNGIDLSSSALSLNGSSRNPNRGNFEKIAPGHKQTL